MKKTPLKRKSKSSHKQLVDKLWKECRRLVYERDKNPDGSIGCFTCPAKNIVGSNRQLGHVPWPKASLGAYLKYDLRVLHYQCYHCNINCGGQGAEAYKRLLLEEGPEFIKQLEYDRQVVVKSTDHFNFLLEKYSQE